MDNADISLSIVEKEPSILNIQVLDAWIGTTDAHVKLLHTKNICDVYIYNMRTNIIVLVSYK